MAKEMPAEAVRRYESGQSANNETIFKHYILVCVCVCVCVRAMLLVDVCIVATLR